VKTVFLVNRYRIPKKPYQPIFFILGKIDTFGKEFPQKKIGGY